MRRRTEIFRIGSISTSNRDEDGTVTVLIEHPEGEQARSARESVNLRPSRALSLED